MFNRKNIFSIALVSTLALGVVIPTNSANATTVTEGTVTAHSLTVRTGPSANYGAQGYLSKGAKVTVLKDHGKFVYVQYGNKKGYVHEDFLKLTSKTASSATVSSATSVNTATVATGSLTVRKGPSAADVAIDWLSKGQKVTILKDHGTFVYVQYGSKKGYVHEGYLKKTTASVSTPTTSTSKPITTTTQTYTVKSGDTLYRIAKNYKVSVADLQKWNHLSSTTIKVGQKLAVNGTAQSTTPATTPTTNPTSSALKGKLIVLDPGHGGKFAGAQGFVHEEDVNLQIALKTRAELQRLGATVIMTRTTDTNLVSEYNADLAARPAVAKRNGASMFISIHANSGASTASGTEVYWYKGDRGDQKLASYVVNAISSETGLRNRGSKYGNFSVIRNAGAFPSVLIETGFVSNKNDASILGSGSGQTNVAEGIAKGVLKYYGK